MNILFASINNPFGPDPYGGAESSMRLMAEKLSDRGHRIVYLTSKVSIEERAVAVARGVDLRMVVQIKGHRFIKSLSRRRWQITIKYLLWRYKLDLVYCFYELPVLEAAIRAKGRRERPKVVMRMAGLAWYIQSCRSVETLHRFLAAFQKLDSVNFISRELVNMTQNKLAELGENVEFRRTFVQDVGSSSPAGRSIAYKDLPSTPFRVVMAARFSDYQKRQDILIRAAKLLSERKNVEINLVGQGVRLDEMKNLSSSLGVSGSVKFHPFMTQAELWSLFERSHILGHVADFEGLGKVIVEAMSRGLPVLVSDVAPLNDYVAEGENGFLVCEHSGRLGLDVSSGLKR